MSHESMPFQTSHDSSTSEKPGNPKTGIEEKQGGSSTYDKQSTTLSQSSPCRTPPADSVSDKQFSICLKSTAVIFEDSLGGHENH